MADAGGGRFTGRPIRPAVGRGPIETMTGTNMAGIQGTRNVQKSWILPGR